MWKCRFYIIFEEKNEKPLVVQIYVDDIIFGATKDYLCKEFAKLM